MAAIKLEEPVVVDELKARRALRNLRTLREAQRRHPSYIARTASESADAPTQCRVLQFSR